jgi:hypothetical protein
MIENNFTNRCEMYENVWMRRVGYGEFTKGGDCRCRLRGITCGAGIEGYARRDITGGPA